MIPVKIETGHKMCFSDRDKHHWINTKVAVHKAVVDIILLTVAVHASTQQVLQVYPTNTYWPRPLQNEFKAGAIYEQNTYQWH